MAVMLKEQKACSVCDLFGRGLKAENRKRVRLALRDFVDKVSVDIEGQSYEVLFKGAKQAVRVTLHPVDGNWLFNPAPGWEMKSK